MKLFIQIIKSPITGILIGIFVAVTTFYFGNKNIDPSYSISTPQLLAEITSDTKSLKLLWDGEEISNIYSVKILFWNAGRGHIDKNNISSTSPIKLTIPGDIQVLLHQFTLTSREDLKMTSQYTEENNYIYIDIDGDEALEAGDGGLIHILYSGEKTSDFKIQGRIKGVKDGISEKNWNRVNIGRDDKLWKSLIFPLFITIGFSAILILGLLRAEKTNEKLSRGDVIFSTSFICLGLYFSYITIYPHIYGVNWAT